MTNAIINFIYRLCKRDFRVHTLRQKSTVFFSALALPIKLHLCPAPPPTLAPSTLLDLVTVVSLVSNFPKVYFLNSVTYITAQEKGNIFEQ